MDEPAPVPVADVQTKPTKRFNLHDLTDQSSPPFEFAFLGPDGERIERKIDFDYIAIEMQTSLPTLFQPTGEMGKDGTPKVGLVVVQELLEKGQHPPAGSPLPNIYSICAVIRRIFQLHPETAIRTCFLVLNAWLTDVEARDRVKKNTPDSPESSVSTPDS